MRQKLTFMVVDLDNYELPLCVGTAEECAKYAGVSADCVRSLARYQKKGRRTKFVQLYLEEEE